MIRITKLSLFIVVIPNLLSVIYFGLIASDIYVSDSAFIVHNSNSESKSGSEMPSLFSKLSATGSTVDYGTVIETYLTSSDALLAINKEMNLRSLASSKEIDIVNRFDPLGINNSNENLLKYFKKIVDIKVDSVSAINTISVKLFSGAEAQKLNQLLIKQSEILINELNEQYRLDAISNAQHEIDVAKKNLEKADQQLYNFRNAPRNSVAPNFIPRFQTLTLERSTAESQLGDAIDALEKAKIDVQKKKMYIEVIARPSLPDYPMLPKRIFDCLAIFAFSIVLWMILKLLIAGAKDHYN